MTRPGAAVAAALALVGVCAGCGGPANGSSATLRRLRAYDVTQLPPAGTQVAAKTDAGSNSSATGKQPALQLVFSTTESPQQLRDHYTANFHAYRFIVQPGPGTATTLSGGIGLDSVLVTINRGTAITQPRPAITLQPSASATYVSVFVIAGG